jgi:hypothetical protein
MALWFLSLAVVTFSLLAVENAIVMSMLSLSQDYAAAGAAHAEVFEALGVPLGTTLGPSHKCACRGQLDLPALLRAVPVRADSARVICFRAGSGRAPASA